jgi:hypothetical protein
MTTLFKQRVPIATVEGADAFITVEWLRMLVARFAEVANGASSSSSSATTTSTSTGGGATSSDHASVMSLLSRVTALEAQVSTLVAFCSDYERRLRALEGGYQA